MDHWGESQSALVQGRFKPLTFSPQSNTQLYQLTINYTPGTQPGGGGGSPYLGGGSSATAMPRVGHPGGGALFKNVSYYCIALKKAVISSYLGPYSSIIYNI